ncbi:hypothetical protein MBLNU230_g7704t1 [Neophaeotheca triangularis]
MASQHQIPETPRVISPSPTPSEKAGAEYFGPETRSKKARQMSVEAIREQNDHEEEPTDPELARARTRSRSPQIERKPTAPRMTALNGVASKSGSTVRANTSSTTTTAPKPTRRKKSPEDKTTDSSSSSPDLSEKETFLSAARAYTPLGYGSAYWRNLSRSPSPLGLIPIHRSWRAFIHKHEIPRKLLHVSIGFGTLYLHTLGLQPSHVHPILLSMLLPILACDIIRFRWPAFNRLYIRLLGAFMRESEAHDRYNGVISYLAGVYLTLRFCHRDVGIVTVLLLSWCDTAASTFGRLWGRYTPRVRRGKSLAGSLAALLVGAGTAGVFWGLCAPAREGDLRLGVQGYAYKGVVGLPEGVGEGVGVVEGPVALGLLGLVTGVVVSVAEAVDVWGLDDNLTIPVLAGLGLEGFLKVFGRW